METLVTSMALSSSSTIQEALVWLGQDARINHRTPASLFTLVLYLRNKERLSYYEQLIRAALHKIPCRVIWILQEDSLPAATWRTSVEAVTFEKANTEIFCELIRIETSPALLERIPLLILPHLIPDLPVYLLWTEDPRHQTTFLLHLASMTQRVIFDTPATEQLAPYAKALLDLLDRCEGDVGDLTWSSLSGWRHLLARTFGTEAAFSSLAQSSTIRLSYNLASQDHSPCMEAMYLQAWITSRLGYTCEEVTLRKGALHLLYKHAQQTLNLFLLPQYESGFDPATLLSVEVESSAHHATYLLKRRPKSRQVFIQYSDKYRCDLPYCGYLDTISEGPKILEEIFDPPVSTHYREMLHLLSTTPWPKTLS